MTTVLHSLHSIPQTQYHIHNPCKVSLQQLSLFLFLYPLTLAGLCIFWPIKCGLSDSTPDLSISLIRHCTLLFTHLDILDNQEKLLRPVSWMNTCMKQSQQSKLRLSYISQQPANCQTYECAKPRTSLPSPAKIIRSIQVFYRLMSNQKLFFL